MSSLVFVRNTQVTDAMLVASNVPEDDYPEYDPLATYALGERVIVLSNHRVYVSSADGNTGNNPLTSPDKWSSPGYTNRWQVFDQSLSSLTVKASTITYQLRPGRAVTGLAVLGLVGALSVRLQMIDPVYGVVYDSTQNVAPQVTSPSWWQWFFGVRVSPRTQAVFLDTPTYPMADLYITIEGTPELAVGMITFGQQRSFGYGIEVGARAGIVSYSTVQRDIDGRASIRKRPYAKRSSKNLLITNDEIDLLYQYLGQIESEPVLMIASDTYEALTGFGIVKNFDIVIPGPFYSECSIEFDGMT